MGIHVSFSKAGGGNGGIPVAKNGFFKAKPNNPNNEVQKMRVNVWLQGIDAETKVRMKVLAAAKGIPLYKLIDELIEEAWEREGDMAATKSVRRKARKEVRKLLKGWK